MRPTKVELINGALDTQFIELRGVVMSAGSNHVSLLTGEGIIQCYGLNLKSSDEIEGAVARVRGVCIPDRDINQRVSGRASPLQLFNAALFIDEPPPSDPFQFRRAAFPTCWSSTRKPTPCAASRLPRSFSRNAAMFISPSTKPTACALKPGTTWACSAGT